ncbi:MAG: DUF2254 domain-containing protein [Cryomorphaceae bacterium]
MKRALFFWNELKSSFWLVPIAIILISIGLALLTIYIDSQHPLEITGTFKYLFNRSAESARSVLSTISGAMIGVAGTVFSITLVALTLASSQFGSRLLRNFMHERINQVVLGTYISTYVYCLLVLNVIEDKGDIAFVPSLSVLVAILAAIANIVLLIVFIHHISMSIQADKVISDISRALSANVKSLYPEKLGREQNEDLQISIDEKVESFAWDSEITSNKYGYLQYIDTKLIMQIATDNDLLLLLPRRPGDFLVKGMGLVKVYSNKSLTEEIENQLLDSFIVGEVRTPQQDTEFSIHQMVEIASRALSPGINDPFTAIACIDNLTSVMVNLTDTEFPSKYRLDKNQKLRVVSNPLNFDGMLDAAFNQIRQFAAESPSVLIRLIEALKIIHAQANTNAQEYAVKRHAKMLLRTARNHLSEPDDFSDFKKRCTWFVEA